MGKLSRDKGKRGEREVRDLFHTYGYPKARRTAQVDGGLSADVVVPEFPELHVEVKRPARWSSRRFLAQAVADAGEDSTPVVFVREDQGRWACILDAEDFFRLLARGA